MQQTDKTTKSHVIPGHCVRIQSEQSAPPEPHKLVTPHVSAPGKPTVKMIKEGDIVRAIEVTCVCGEVIRLECAF